MISLSDMKSYLRVDFSDDDEIIKGLIVGARRICLDILRIKDIDEIEDKEKFKISQIYAAAYFYENREERNHKDLMLDLRALLSSDRKAGF